MKEWQRRGERGGMRKRYMGQEAREDRVEARDELRRDTGEVLSEQLTSDIRSSHISSDWVGGNGTMEMGPERTDRRRVIG
eukprot:761498-Hanusia_phi.AAC.1